MLFRGNPRAEAGQYCHTISLNTIAGLNRHRVVGNPPNYEDEVPIQKPVPGKGDIHPIAVPSGMKLGCYGMTRRRYGTPGKRAMNGDLQLERVLGRQAVL